MSGRDHQGGKKAGKTLGEERALGVKKKKGDRRGGGGLTGERDRDSGGRAWLH